MSVASLQNQGSIRLNHYLAQAGICSRREGDRLIARGEVKINGRKIKELGVKVDASRDEVSVHGEPVRLVTESVYMLLNKPQGYVTTAKDEHGRLTVFNLIQAPLRVFPVGRLDRDSEGLLLLSNDGALAYRMTHPRYKVPKVYHVVLNQKADEKLSESFKKGVKIDHSRPVRGEVIFPQPHDRRYCEVTIRDGRNRQVRRMFEATGYRVKNLRRIQFGPLSLGKLKPGAWRYLNQKEIRQMTEAVGL